VASKNKNTIEETPMTEKMIGLGTSRAETTGLAAPTRARTVILALISIAVVINYLDRAIIGITAPAFKVEFGLQPAVLGIVFSAFSWTYFLSQIPSGILLDRFGPRMIYSLSLAFWSVVTLLQAFAGSVGALIGLRLGLASRKHLASRPIAMSWECGFRVRSAHGPSASTPPRNMSGSDF
jgi:hypothetical protein